MESSHHLAPPGTPFVIIFTFWLFDPPMLTRKLQGRCSRSRYWSILLTMVPMGIKWTKSWEKLSAVPKMKTSVFLKWPTGQRQAWKCGSQKTFIFCFICFGLFVCESGPLSHNSSTNPRSFPFLIGLHCALCALRPFLGKILTTSLRRGYGLR